MSAQPTNEMTANPYDVLGVPRTATGDEIKRAYIEQVRQHPPERQPAEFKRIRAAYDQLRSPEKRLDVDMLMLEDWPAPARVVPLSPIDTSVQAEHLLDVLKACVDLEGRGASQYFREVDL